jgi:DNA-binding NarL/FixJ family response regulator
VSDPIRVLVADDQTLVREGLMTLLQLAAGIEPVAAASDGEEAVRLAARHRPDVVLMDLRMPRLDGVEATRRIRAAQPETEIVVLTTHADDQSILGALQAGARGYLTKDAGIAEIARGIQAAAAHQTLLDPAVQTRLLAAATAASTATAPLAPAAELPDELTPREAEVLRLIARGMSNAEIAAALVVSEATVKRNQPPVRKNRRA